MTADVMLETLADGVLQIRLNRPQRMNALGVETHSIRRATGGEVHRCMNNEHKGVTDEL